MVDAARALLTNNQVLNDFGASDLELVLGQADLDVAWRSDRGLDALVDLARKRGAFDTDGHPLPGDIVLFHNQLDANGNGEADDWLTGCGIVLALHGERFDALVRTGHRPRRISAWPGGPQRRAIDGEVVNSFLRVPHRSDGSDVQYLAGSLYAGHIDIEELAAGRK